MSCAEFGSLELDAIISPRETDPRQPSWRAAARTFVRKAGDEFETQK
jgi:hypothetical protein